MITSTLQTNKEKIPLVYKKPVSSSNSDIFAQDKKAAFNKAVNEKNPLALATFEEQGASVQAKLLRLYQNPSYQKLTPAERVGVRARIYKDYVVPSFKAKGIPAPDFKVWLKETKAENASHFSPEQYFQSPSMQAANDLAYGLVNRLGKIGMFGTKITNAAMMEQFGLTRLLLHVTAPGVDIDKVFPGLKKNEEVNNKYIGIMRKGVNTALQSTNFFIANHPREGFLASAPRWTGEQIAMLPMYRAAGLALEASGARTLTAKMATSPIGKFVANRLYSGAEFFIGSLFSGDKPQEAVENAVGNAALETVIIPPGKAVASNPLIKKWTAKLLSMGGRPLAETISKSAIEEATFGRLEHDVHTTTAFNGRVTETRTPVEKGFKPGYFTYLGQNIEYKTAEERLAVYEKIEESLLAHRQAEDPLLHKIVQAERLSAESIALRNFGKPLSKMTSEEINGVLARRLELIREAEFELPAHEGDLNKADIAADVNKQAVESPLFWHFKAEMDSLGFPSTEEVVNEEEINAIQEQTGIKSDSGAVSKLEKIRPAKAEKEITSGFASLSPEDFDKNRKDTVAYLKNPNYERLASDGTKIGRRDKRPWNVRVKAANTAEFVDFLKEADGNTINFENDYHRMLYHYANRDQLPAELRAKLLREMKKVVETGPRPRYKMTAKDFAREADWQLVHLQLLAQSGRLGKEGNVFHSSKFGGPENWTPWQNELHTEVEKQELQLIDKITTRHPAAKKAARSTMKKLQAMRFNSDNTEEWNTYNQAVYKYLTTDLLQKVSK